MMIDEDKRNIVGFDNEGRRLHEGDMCKFTINNKEKVGMIEYCEDEYAYCFTMQDESFPQVIIRTVDIESISKICDFNSIYFKMNFKWFMQYSIDIGLN
jgi:hypothetical protein